MKHWRIYLAAMAVFALLPAGNEQDVAKLRPAELLYIYKEAGTVHVCTDMGDAGKGRDLAGAVEDMRQNTPGEVFLETAEYVLVTEETKPMLQELEKLLRPGTRVVLAAGPIEPETAAAYLRVHRPTAMLRDCLTGQRKPEKLMRAGEKYYLE